TTFLPDRTDPERYAVQFRNLADKPTAGPRFTFADNAVFCPLENHPYRWGITISNSRNGLVRGNVLYNWAGAGMTVEDDACSGTVIEKNFNVLTRGNGISRSWAGEGEGFALWTTDMVVRDNVSADTAYHGFSYFQMAARGPGPVREFARNEAYGSYG